MHICYSRNLEYSGKMTCLFNGLLNLAFAHALFSAKINLPLLMLQLRHCTQE